MNFDLMRLVAALLVVAHHTFHLSGRTPPRLWGVEDLGALGVSIFFVISGYLVSASYKRDPKTYLAKRLLRIEPGLIASLVVTVALLSFLTTASQVEYWRGAVLYVLRNALLYPATYELPGVLTVNPRPRSRSSTPPWASSGRSGTSAIAWPGVCSARAIASVSSAFIRSS